MDLLDMEKHEREELILIVESSVHHVVMDIVLSQLSEHDKKVLLSHMIEGRHDDIWDLLNAKTDHIETHIRKGVDKLKKDLHKDIARAKSKKHKK
jgi:DNA-directed RNA polymerase specialized sigma24 family protein